MNGGLSAGLAARAGTFPYPVLRPSIPPIGRPTARRLAPGSRFRAVPSARSLWSLARSPFR